MRICSTFLNVNPGSPEHLWFVCTEVDTNGQVVIVNLTSDDVDQTCVLDIGDHPFVRYASVIAYRHAQIVSAARLTIAANNSYVVPKEDASAPLMCRIRDGALASTFTPNIVKRAVRLCSWSPP